MDKRENESYLSYAKRITKAKEDGLISYEEFGDYLLGDENVYSADNTRKFYYQFKKVLNKVDNDTTYSQDDLLKEIEQAKRELEKEKIKVQTLNLEYRRNLRSEARNDLYKELISDSIKNLAPIKVKAYEKSKPKKMTALLNIADVHYGQEINLQAFNGEVVNKYSPEIFESRMWHLMAQMKNDFNYDKLVIFGLGDYIQNYLRISDIQKCQTGVVESVIKFSEFMSIWLDKLQEELGIEIEFQLVGGNHDSIRLLTGKKGDFEEETADKLIYEFMKIRLENNKNIIIKLSSGIAFYNFYGINVFGEHGESDLKKSISFYEDYYGIECDIFIAGHLHRSSQETIGMAEIGDKQVVRVPSIVGACEYSKKLKRSSRAGCKFYLFSQNGIECEKIYYLN